MTRPPETKTEQDNMSGEFEGWSEDLKNIQKATQSLKRSLNKIGSPTDTVSFRQQV